MSSIHRVFLCCSLLALLLVPGLDAREVPAAVSPGGSASVAEVGSACPSFSWSAVADAAGYELVVYELLGSGEAAPEPTLSLTLPAGVSSWSPSGADCLDAGKSYAWLVRTEQSGEESREAWSEARFFRVPDRPSIDEVQEAMAVLRRYFGPDSASRGEPGKAGKGPDGSQTADSLASATGEEGPSLERSIPEAASFSFPSAIQGELPSTTGTTLGVYGVSNSTEGMGVVGESTATSNLNRGVFGLTSSPIGRGVEGVNTALEGVAFGVLGQTNSTFGTAIQGSALSTSGSTVGVWGASRSPNGIGGFFSNTGGGRLLAGSSSGSLTDIDFEIANDGTLTATGFVGDGSGLTGVTAEDANTLDGIDSTSFLRGDTDDVVESGGLTFDSGTYLEVTLATLGVGSMTKSGTGLVANLNADLLDGNEATAFSAAGHDHFGESWSGTAASGLSVSNASTTTASAAVSGLHTATSGIMDGVYGKSAADDGHGVHGEGAGSDQAVGVYGETASFNGAGGLFVHTDGGLLLAANDEESFSDLEFKVDAQGNVYADGTYRCGNGINDSAGTLDESEIAPCLTDDFPADFAEMLPRGDGALEAGDVLAVDGAGRLVATTAPYQASVVGVHSTRPSYVGNSRYLEDSGYAPLALTGLVPVKVTAENGPVVPGALLTPSSTPGHAMRATADAPAGSVIGKALEPLEGASGKILMMVVLQ